MSNQDEYVIVAATVAFVGMMILLYLANKYLNK